jgi:hypothetical protein
MPVEWMVANGIPSFLGSETLEIQVSKGKAVVFLSGHWASRRGLFIGERYLF